MSRHRKRIAIWEREVAELRSRVPESRGIELPFCVVSSKGLPIFCVRETEHGGELTLYDTAGGRIAVIGQALNGGNGIAIFNATGQRVAGFFADRDGGHLAVYNNDGQGVAGVLTCPSGGYLNVRDRDGRNYAGLIAHAEGAGMGVFEKGIPVRSLPE